MSRRVGGVSILSAAALLLAGVPATADTFKGCYGAKYTTLEVLEISEGHSVVSWTAFGTGYVLEDPSSPFNGMSGPCTEAIEIKDDMVVDHTGKCVRTDKDGDKILVSVGSFETLSNGTWTIEGLTGKFLGIKGAGTWRVLAENDKYYHACFDMTWTRE